MDRFVNNILPHTPGCPEQLIKSEVLRTAIEFCKKTLIWQSEEESTAAGGDDTIALSPSSGKIEGVKVEVNGTEIFDYTLSDVTVALDNELSEGDEIKVTLYLVPERDAASLPNILYIDWLDGISAGARAALMVMPEKPWSNPKMAQIHLQTYQHQVGQALVLTRKKNMREPVRLVMRPWV